MEATGLVDNAIELRYLGLVRLGGGIAGASTWDGLVRATADALDTMGTPGAVRLWCTTPDGFSELARTPTGADFPAIAQGELRAAAERGSPASSGDGPLLVGLHASGVSMGVLEVAGADAHSAFLSDAAPIVASAIGLLAAQGVGNTVLEPRSVDAASDAAPVMAAFAEQAGRLLAHDRLSAYLLTPNGQAFERFAVATSPIIPGEGVVIPFEDVGLRHIVITNRALVSDDLSADPRIVGREDRVIARAGFRGLLSAPLRREGRPVGVLNFVSKTVGFYRDEDIPIAQQMADQVSAFLENLRRQRSMCALVRQEATERERGRVSRDLLDTVAQSAPTIGAIAADLRDRLAPVDDQAAADAERIIELSRRELADIRRAVLGLSPRAFDNRSLEDVVESTLLEFRETTGIKTGWTVTGDTTRLAATVEQATYRILQEALANVRFHSQAESLRVELAVSDTLVLTIEDDGLGFDAEEASSPALGVQGMTERASALGGAFSIDTAPGQGTRVELEVPAVGDAGHAPPAPDGELEQPAAAAAGSLRVFVAERNTLTRAGLTRILEGTGSIRVVGEASSADEVRGQVARLSPDVILLDEQLEADHSLKLTRELAASSPSSAILITARGAVTPATDLLGAGGTGVIHKSIEPDELVNAVRAVAGGSRLIAGSGGGAEDDPEGGGPQLSKRQREILALVAAGQTNAEIADALFFATKTVERHVGTIFAKLGARNRAHAAALAVSQQLVELDDA